MITAARFFGGAHWRTVGSPHPYRLTSLFSRFYSLRANSAGLEVIAEDPETLAPAVRCGFQFTVWNVGAVNSFALKDHTGATLATLAAGDIVDVWLGWTGSSATAAGSYVWSVRTRTRL